MQRAFGCCFKPPVALSRAGRRLKHGDRMRLLMRWQDVVAEKKRLLAKLRLAAQSLANRPARSALNAWKEMREELLRKKQLLRVAVAGMMNAQSRKALNMWREAAEEMAVFKQRLRAAAARMSPEGRAKAQFLTQLKAIAAEAAKMRRGMAGFRPEGQGFKQWRSAVEEQKAALAALRRGGAALFMRKARMSFNKWVEVWTAMARMAAFLKRISPEGRAMQAAFDAFKELYYETFVGKRGDAAHLRKMMSHAMTNWIAATFEAFHILAGGTVATVTAVTM